TGKHPFKSDNPAATVRNILTVDPERPSSIVPNYPKGLEDVVMKALSRNKEARFSSAQEMMVALEHALPATVSANAEKNAEVFLHRLFEKRIIDRNGSLQSALKAAGLDAGSSSGKHSIKFPRSHSTMRAVAVDSDRNPEVGSAVEEASRLGLHRSAGARRWMALTAAAV